MRSLSSLVLTLLLFGLVGFTAACADSGGGSASDGATGSVALALTDAPTDEFSQVLVTVLRVYLIPGDDDTEREMIFDGRETFDLLSLENVSEPFAIADDVPAGTYSKLRMEIAEIELIRNLEGGGTESEFPRLPGGDRIDLNPRGGFEVRGGDTLAIQLDMDARRSIQINETGNGRYNFRPQVFVDILREDRVSRLVAISGVVEEIDDSADPLRLRVCEVAVEHRDRDTESDEYCLTVFVYDETSIFDDAGLSVPEDEIRVGDPVSVLGYFTSDEDSRFAIDAVVIEIGGPNAFLTLTGVVSTGYEADVESFVLDLDPGQGFDPVTSLEISLSEETLVFNRAGERLDPEEIDDNDRVEVDGVLALSSDEADQLRASVVFVREFELPIE